MASAECGLQGYAETEESVSTNPLLAECAPHYSVIIFTTGDILTNTTGSLIRNDVEKSHELKESRRGRFLRFWNCDSVILSAFHELVLLSGLCVLAVSAL